MFFVQFYEDDKLGNIIIDNTTYDLFGVVSKNLQHF